MTYLAVWVALFGLWPLADPGHHPGDGPIVWADLALHAAAIFWLAWRYRIRVERRPHPCGACIGTGWVTAVRPRIGICVIDCLACDGTGRNKETT